MSDFDVIVAGGGPSGIAAAIASARQGKKTCLLERYDVLGGMGTVGLVNNFCNAYYDGERFIIGGIFAEIRQKLIEKDALFVTRGLEPFNHRVYGELLKQLCVDAGVDVRLNQAVENVEFKQRAAIFKLAPAGEILRAKVVIDATGDGAILAGAGVSFTMGRALDNAVMPLTFCYIIGPFDRRRLEEGVPGSFLRDENTGARYAYVGGQPELVKWVKEAKARGELTIPRERIAVAYSVPGAIDYLAVNFGRVSIADPTDPEELAQAEELGRAQAKEGEAFFRKYVPGFENASIVEYARQIGVRESRQILGEYCLTGEDVLGCRQFEDVVAQCCYSIDIHDPKSSGTTLVGIPQGKHYDIPLRCLIAKDGPPNLIAAGRCISATHEAMSSFRVSPSVMAIGEAAGIVAALAVSDGIACRDVAYRDVRQRLLEAGAILE
jgi:hypothetical protein